MLGACEKQKPPIKAPGKGKGNTKSKPAKAKGTGKSQKLPKTPAQKMEDNAQEAQPTKRAWKKDHELTRAQRRRRVVSRAYHKTFLAAVKEGITKDEAKMRARGAVAGKAFDEEFPRSAAQKRPAAACEARGVALEEVSQGSAMEA